MGNLFCYTFIMLTVTWINLPFHFNIILNDSCIGYWFEQTCIDEWAQYFIYAIINLEHGISIISCLICSISFPPVYLIFHIWQDKRLFYFQPSNNLFNHMDYSLTTTTNQLCTFLHLQTAHNDYTSNLIVPH